MELTKVEQIAANNLLRRKRELEEKYPWRHKFKHYSWSREYVESINKMNFLCAANQIGKSTANIRKVIEWATNKKLWTELWDHTPSLFWYFYPSVPQCNIEFKFKWIKYLPDQEKFKNDPEVGWRAEYSKKDILAIHFNSGVSVYFKSYGQSTTNLQSSTLDAIFCDEELPMEHYDELMFRISESDGYFHMVFTATLGQDFWRKTIEPRKGEEPNLPDAHKQQVTMYDCLEFEDGSQGRWTNKKIDIQKKRCKNKAALLRRIYGRFILDSGRMFAGFDPNENVKPYHHIPKTWNIFAGVDVGSGGENNHPAAVVFVATNPDYTEGRVFLGWRGDGVETTAGDVLKKFQELRGDMQCADQRYDWESKDFETIASRVGEPFQPADKRRESGLSTVNALFKAGILAIYDTPELQKLVIELLTLKIGAAKTNAADDFADALRYCVATIPWNWTVIAKKLEEKPDEPLEDKSRYDDRRRMIDERTKKEDEDYLEEEFNEWNDMYGT